MFDDLQGDTAVFDFDEFANHLLEQGLEASPAELHGCLCGLLAAGGSEQPEAGLSALTQALGLDLHGELAGLVMQLYTVTAAAMLDEEFDFHPLLPDDDSADVEVRTAALAGWCKAFLAGFAQISAVAGDGAGALSADSSEILADFAAIAEAEVSDEEDEDEDAAEGSYAEILEYVRFATLNVFMDSTAGAESGGSPAPPGRPPH